MYRFKPNTIKLVTKSTFISIGYIVAHTTTTTITIIIIIIIIIIVIV